MTRHLNDLFALAHIARTDHARSERTGRPEIILAERKTPDQCLGHCCRTARTCRAGAAQSRLTGPARRPNLGHTVTQTGGRVGILTAGTSDIPMARAQDALRWHNHMGIISSVAHFLQRPYSETEHQKIRISSQWSTMACKQE